MDKDQEAVGGERQAEFWLARSEKKTLVKIANRLPRWVLPDDLTALGILSAFAIAGCYWASGESRYWLLATLPLFILHWLGDSLDGTLARVREITRPKYGYYLDHIVDAFSTALIGLGLGLSPYLSFAVAALAVILYLILSINVYLEGEIFKRFDISYGKFGPTEMRIFLVALSLIFFFAGPLPVTIGNITTPALNLVVLLICCYMLVAVLVRARQNLGQLAKDEPSASRR